MNIISRPINVLYGFVTILTHSMCIFGCCLVIQFFLCLFIIPNNKTLEPDPKSAEIIRRNLDVKIIP